MTPNSSTEAATAVSWLGGANTALGVLTVMLFPFALPILVITIAFVVPLLLLAIPLVVLLGLVLQVRRHLRRALAS